MTTSKSVLGGTLNCMVRLRLWTLMILEGSSRTLSLPLLSAPFLFEILVPVRVRYMVKNCWDVFVFDRTLGQKKLLKNGTKMWKATWISMQKVENNVRPVDMPLISINIIILKYPSKIFLLIWLYEIFCIVLNKQHGLLNHVYSFS